MAVKLEQIPTKVLEIEDEEDVMEGFNGKQISDIKPRMPPFPSKRINPDRAYLFFDEWLPTVPDDEFNHFSIYLYRSWPRIDRTRYDPKAPINIDKLLNRQACQIENISSLHGNGTYKILFNDINKAIKGKGGTIGEVHFTIDEPDNPPKLVLDEVILEHPDNKSFVNQLRNDGKINREGDLVAQPNNTASNDPVLMGLVKDLVNKATQPAPRDNTSDKIAEMYMKANEQSMQMIKEQIKGDDPEKTIKLMGMIKELMPKPDSGTGLLEVMLKMQADANSKESAMMMKMFELLKPVPPVAQESEIDKIIKYKELFGWGNDSGREAKKSTVETLIEHGAPVLSKVLETVNLVIQGGMMKQRMEQGNYVQNPVQQPTQAPQSTQQLEETTQMPTHEVNQFTQLLAQYGGLIVSAINNGTEGSAFASSIETMFGPVVYEGIAGMGKEGIMLELQKAPNVWGAIGGAPKLVEVFIEDFLAYGQGEEEAEGEVA